MYIYVHPPGFAEVKPPPRYPITQTTPKPKANPTKAPNPKNHKKNNLLKILEKS
jgi:hypothetical protein